MDQVPQEFESLKEEVSHIESESRMILPGLQALFGFQLVAVYNDRFNEALPRIYQIFHWGALACTAVATILVIAPAAYHRQSEPHMLSKKFIRKSNLFIAWALFPMILGCVIAFFLIGYIITNDSTLSFIISAILYMAFVFTWYIHPWMCRQKNL